MNKLFTDEIVLKSSRAMVAKMTGCRDKQCAACERNALNYADETRACLNVAAPLIIEKLLSDIEVEARRMKDLELKTVGLAMAAACARLYRRGSRNEA